MLLLFAAISRHEEDFGLGGFVADGFFLPLAGAVPWTCAAAAPTSPEDLLLEGLLVVPPAGFFFLPVRILRLVSTSSLLIPSKMSPVDRALHLVDEDRFFFLASLLLLSGLFSSLGLLLSTLSDLDLRSLPSTSSFLLLLEEERSLRDDPPGGLREEDRSRGLEAAVVAGDLSTDRDRRLFLSTPLANFPISPLLLALVFFFFLLEDVVVDVPTVASSAANVTIVIFFLWLACCCCCSSL